MYHTTAWYMPVHTGHDELGTYNRSGFQMVPRPGGHGAIAAGPVYYYRLGY
jgi:hypothetical protein